MFSHEKYKHIWESLKLDYVYPVIDVQVALKCNWNCKNCIKFCGMEDITGLDYSTSFLSMEQVDKFINDMKMVYEHNNKPGRFCCVVYLTGGEPLLHPELTKVFFKIKSELADTEIIDYLLINSNLVMPAPDILSEYIINFSNIKEKLEVHNAVFLHPDDYNQARPTYRDCKHDRKDKVVYNYMGYNLCCAADGYIRLFNLKELIVPTLPDNINEFPLDKMDSVCQHCPFGCENISFEKDVGRPISEIYLNAGRRNKSETIGI